MFLLRAQDAFAADAVRAYADIVEHHNGDPEIVRKSREWVGQMASWPKKKFPDLPAE